MRRGTCCGAVQDSDRGVVEGDVLTFGGLVLHLTELGEPSCPFHAVGKQTQMSSGEVREAVAELLPPSCITASGQRTRGQGEDPRGCGVWASPSRLCGSRKGGLWLTLGLLKGNEGPLPPLLAHCLLPQSPAAFQYCKKILFFCIFYCCIYRLELSPK